MVGKLPLIALALFLASPLKQNPPAHRQSAKPSTDTPQAIPAQRVADSYAIYSLLVPGAPSDEIARTPANDWSIANTTVNITDMDPAVPPDGQLKAPPENTRAFNEAVHDYNTRKYERFRLQATSFHPNPPLPLINEQQVNDIRQSRSVNTGITFFSAVYFNNNQTAALVYVNDW